MLDAIDLFVMFVFLVVFLVIGGLLVVASYRYNGDLHRSLARLRNLKETDNQVSVTAGVSGFALSALPKVGALLLSGKEARRTRIQARLVRAGIYGNQAPRVLLGVQLIVTLALPTAVAFAPWLFGLLAAKWALPAGLGAACLGLLAPGLWLDHRTRRRDHDFRRALPDALDMLVLCLEGGVSLQAAIQRVSAELQIAHPTLGAEMNIVQSEVELGQTPGEAFKRLGERCGLEDVRNLAAVLLQSERFGTGAAKALRIHAESSRQEWQQRAEEQAQKAAVKVLFPTLLCIFPAIFIVLLGPAAYQIADMFSKMK